MDATAKQVKRRLKLLARLTARAIWILILLLQGRRHRPNDSSRMPNAFVQTETPTSDWTQAAVSVFAGTPYEASTASSLPKASSDPVRAKREVSEGGLLESLDDPRLPEMPRTPVATGPTRGLRAMLAASSLATVDTEQEAAQSTEALGFLRNRAVEAVSWAAKLEPVSTLSKFFSSLQGRKESGQSSPLGRQGTFPSSQLEMERQHHRGPDKSAFHAGSSPAKGDDESATAMGG